MKKFLLSIITKLNTKRHLESRIGKIYFAVRNGYLIDSQDLYKTFYFPKLAIWSMSMQLRKTPVLIPVQLNTRCTSSVKLGDMLSQVRKNAEENLNNYVSTVQINNKKLTKNDIIKREKRDENTKQNTTKYFAETLKSYH